MAVPVHMGFWGRRAFIDLGGLEQCSHCLRTFANIPDVVAPTVAVIAQLCQSGPEDRYGSLPAAAVIVATSEQSTCCHSFQQSAGSTAGSRHSGRFAAAPPTPYRSIRRCRRVPVAGRFALARSPLSSNPMDPGMHSLLTHLYIRPHPYTASTHCICNRACSGIMLDCLACPLGLSTCVSPSTFKGTSACPCGSPAFEGDYRKALLRAGAVDVVCAALQLRQSEVELCTYANVFLFFMGKHIAASEKKDAASGEGAYQLVRQPCEHVFC